MSCSAPLARGVQNRNFGIRLKQEYLPSGEDESYSAFSERSSSDDYGGGSVFAVSTYNCALEFEIVGAWIPLRIGWRNVSVTEDGTTYTYDEDDLLFSIKSFSADSIADPAPASYSYKDDFRIWRAV